MAQTIETQILEQLTQQFGVAAAVIIAFLLAGIALGIYLLRTERREHMADNDRWREMAESQETRIANAEAERVRMDKEFRDAIARQDELRTQSIESQHRLIESMRDQLDRQQSKIGDLQNKLEVISRDNTSLKTQIEQSLSDLSSLREEGINIQASLKAQINALEIEKETLLKQLKEAQEQNKILSKANEWLRNENESQKAKAVVQDGRISDLEKKVTEMKAMSSEKDAQLDAKNRELEAKNTEISTLLAARFHGEPK
jgi:predicted  nucleic acid-binding Zn-ribbon protein